MKPSHSHAACFEEKNGLFSFIQLRRGQNYHSRPLLSGGLWLDI